MLDGFYFVEFLFVCGFQDGEAYLYILLKTRSYKAILTWLDATERP